TLYPLVFDSSLPHPYPPSFPTRRSSDLPHRRLRLLLTGALVRLWSRGSEALGDLASHLHRHGHLEEVNVGAYRLPGGQPPLRPRSEEHTSELQSRENLVCRLLLEKKKKK